MIYCKRCLYPINHPYGLVLDKQGVCAGCRVHEEKDTLDWRKRFAKLEDIVNTNAQKMGKKGFDCIIPVTGGGDSYFIVHTVKNVLGMNPLLVNYNSHYNTRVGIRNLSNLATVFDCDVITSTASPTLLKKVTRYTMQKYGSMYWQALAGYQTFPVQMAVKFRIPLIIWGVQGWSEQNGMFSHLDEVEMTERLRKEHGLMGIDAADLVTPESGLSVQDVQAFAYPDDHELEAVGVRGIYLSNYIRWDSKTQHEDMIRMYGYETAAQPRTFNTYEDVHCFHSAGLNDYLKYLKYGYSRVTDHASREIRLKRMTRETGAQLVGEYTARKPQKDLDVFLDWIGMSEAEFWKTLRLKRDAKIWRQAGDQWELLDSVTKHVQDSGVDAVRLPSTDDWRYKLTGSQEPNVPDDDYLLMGRGYTDKFNFGALDPISPGAKLSPRECQRKPLLQVKL